MTADITHIRRATLADLELVAPLFDAYRQFYERPADLDLARNYIEARMRDNDSVIFLATNTNEDGGEKALGFTQLYPTYCSVSATNVWVLYDLFVDPSARRQGIAQALMAEAKKLGEASGAAWLKLETAVTNKAGQALYERLGWHRDTDFYTYHLPLGEN